jgi:hypothetical protein
MCIVRSRSLAGRVRSVSFEGDNVVTNRIFSIYRTPRNRILFWGAGRIFMAGGYAVSEDLKNDRIP